MSQNHAFFANKNNSARDRDEKIIKRESSFVLQN